LWWLHRMVHASWSFQQLHILLDRCPDLRSQHCLSCLPLTGLDICLWSVYIIKGTMLCSVLKPYSTVIPIFLAYVHIFGFCRLHMAVACGPTDAIALQLSSYT
jgi:hypothetical protein